MQNPTPGPPRMLGPVVQSTTMASYDQSAPNSPQRSPKLKAVVQSTTLANHGQHVYIRVRRSLLEPTSTAAMNPPTTSPPSAHLYLIEGTIQDIGRYADTTVDWVIKVAHLICAPSREGQVYTHMTGTPHDWYHRDRGTEWRQVVRGDPLLPGIYEFEARFPIVLSRLSAHQSRSMTSSGAESSAAIFRRHIEIRDDRCVVTHLAELLVASHLLPKRMGTEGAKRVVEEFVGAQAARQVHRFHAMIGILLIGSLDDLVDKYMLGFYHNAVSNDTYIFSYLITQACHLGRHIHSP